MVVLILHGFCAANAYLIIKSAPSRRPTVCAMLPIYLLPVGFNNRPHFLRSQIEIFPCLSSFIGQSYSAKIDVAVLPKRTNPSVIMIQLNR